MATDLWNPLVSASEWRVKLDDVEDAIKNMQERHDSLREDYKKLSIKYNATKICVMDSIWRYIPQNCEKFEYLPALDETLLENENYIGNYYRLGSKLGSGQFSTVRRCESLIPKVESESKIGAQELNKNNNNNNNNIYAVKVIKKEKYKTADSIHRAENEVKALKILGHHKNILKLLDIIHGKSHLYLISEILPMDLFEFTNAYKKYINDDVVGYILNSLLNGVNHMGENGLVHRDLKPENVLIQVENDNFKIRICDFGLARPHLEGQNLIDFCGSPGFFAPESVSHSPYCGFKADLFSVGCIGLELLTGMAFFRDKWLVPYRLLRSSRVGDFKFAIKESISASQSKLQAVYPNDMSHGICSMINFDPSTRPAMKLLIGNESRNGWLSRADLPDRRERVIDVLVNRLPASKSVACPRTGRGRSLHKKSKLPEVLGTS